MSLGRRKWLVVSAIEKKAGSFHVQCTKINVYIIVFEFFFYPSPEKKTRGVYMYMYNIYRFHSAHPSVCPSKLVSTCPPKLMDGF